MMEKSNLMDLYRTEKIDLNFSVNQRLASLSKWNDEFEQEDKVLAMKSRSLNPENKTDNQLGQQIAAYRRVLRQKQVMYPLEIEQEYVREVGYQKIREHLRQQFVGLTKEQKLLWLNNFLFIMTPDLRELCSKIFRIRAYRSLGQQRCFLLGGPSGMGKTTFLTWYQFHSLPIVSEEKNIIPVIRINAQVSNKSAKVLYRRIISAAGATYYASDDEDELLGQVIMIIDNCDVELLIIDEVEHIRTHEMRRKILEISNLTRGIPIICASCNPVRWAEGDEEVQGRWNDFFYLEPYHGLRLKQLLAYIELLLPFPNSSNLPLLVENDQKGRKKSNNDNCNLIQSLTKGILRDIMVLIHDACEKAILNDMPNISEDLIRTTWGDIQKKSITNDMFE